MVFVPFLEALPSPLSVLMISLTTVCASALIISYMENLVKLFNVVYNLLGLSTYTLVGKTGIPIANRVKLSIKITAILHPV